MAGFFSLGGGGGGGGSGSGGRDHHHHHQEATTSQHQHQHQHQHQQEQENEDQTPNSNSLFLYRSSDQEIYNKGLELWQQYYHHQRLNQQQQQQHQDHHTLGVGVGSVPSSSTRRNLINFSDDSSSSRSGFQVMRQGGVGGGGGGGAGAPGGMNCQDCGNQAKKDCPHMRCRTCCKSRGFQCTTHVKSTWVPAAKRRERQQQLTALQQQQQQQQQHLQLRGGSGSGDINHPKRHRENTGLEVENFPAEVNSAAVFRCVKVLSAMDEADQEQYAYQTAVNIGGHVFKGILYDQGLESQYMSASGGGGGGGGESSSGGGGGGGAHHHQHHHHHQQLNLITSMTDTDTTAIAGSSNQVVANLLDPSLIYPAPLNAFMAGTQFFPPPRS